MPNVTITPLPGPICTVMPYYGAVEAPSVITLAIGEAIGPVRHVTGTTTLTGNATRITEEPQIWPQLATPGVSYVRIQNSLDSLTALDAALVLLTDEDIIPVLCITGPDEPTDLAALSALVQAACVRYWGIYGSDVNTWQWELFNEAGDWATRDAVYDTVVAAFQAAQVTNPSLTVTLLAPSNRRDDFAHLAPFLAHIQDVGLPEGIDLKISAHFYKYGASVQIYDFTAWYAQLAALLVTYGLDELEVILTECGLDGKAKDLRLRTEYNAAYWVWLMGLPAMQNIARVHLSGAYGQGYGYTNPDTGTWGGGLGLWTLNADNLAYTCERALEGMKLLAGTIYAVTGVPSGLQGTLGAYVDEYGVWAIYNLNDLAFTLTVPIGNNNPLNVGRIDATYGNSYARWVAGDVADSHSGLFNLTDGTTRPQATPVGGDLTIEIPGPGVIFLLPD